MSKEIRHYEDSTSIPVSSEEVFGFVDDHSRFSAHMSKSSWMMGGGSMKTEVDAGRGQEVGSHIRMNGKVLGIKLSLDEVVTKREPPRLKAWETVGSPRLLVIGPYQMGFELNPTDGQSTLKIFIDYEMPKTRLLGQLFGGWYAKWCVKQMLTGTQDYFKSIK